MRLTNYSDYALRCLIYLAVKPSPFELCHISDIATAYDISKSHLTKVIHQLATLGYIDSVRGKNGGIRLAKPPKEINLGSVVRQTEPDFAIVDCFAPNVDMVISKFSSDGNPTQCSGKIPTALIDHDDVVRCKINPVCQLKTVFFEATQGFVAVLDQYTLADVIGNAGELDVLLAGV